MRKIRIGKDIKVRWSLHRTEAGERVPFNINGESAELRVVTPIGEIKAAEVKYEGNVVEWTFRGAEQTCVGYYTLVLVQNAGKEGMITVDTCKAFQLVAHSCEETPDVGGDVVTDAVMLEGEVAFAPIVIELGGEPYDDTELREMLAEQGEKLTELSAEVSELSERVDELEKGGQGGGASVEGETLVFSATSSAQVIGNTLKL